MSNRDSGDTWFYAIIFCVFCVPIIGCTLGMLFNVPFPSAHAQSEPEPAAELSDEVLADWIEDHCELGGGHLLNGGHYLYFPIADLNDDVVELLVEKNVITEAETDRKDDD